MSHKSSVSIYQHKQHIFYFFYVVAFYNLCNQLIYSLFSLWESIQSALLLLTISESLSLTYEISFSKSYIGDVMLFYLRNFSIGGFIGVAIFLLILLLFTTLVIVKSNTLVKITNESNSKLAGKTFSVIFSALSSVLSLPVFMCTIGTFSCKIVSVSREVTCNNAPHYIIMIVSSILIIIHTTFCISFFHLWAA